MLTCVRLAKVFNGAVNTTRQAEIEQWIEGKFPDMWAKLRKLGFQMRYNHTKVLPLDVKMEP